jgi:hypothetical protein
MGERQGSRQKKLWETWAGIAVCGLGSSGAVARRHQQLERTSGRSPRECSIVHRPDPPAGWSPRRSHSHSTGPAQSRGVRTGEGPYIDRPRRDGLWLQLTKEMTLHLFFPLAESPILFIATRIHTQLRELPTRLATRIIEAALHLSSAGREWLRQ